MPFIEIVLPDEEEVIRLFARPKIGKSPIIRSADFSRRMESMSGISMFRVKAKYTAMDAWASNWHKGTLIATAGPLKKLGLKFYTSSLTDDHFSVRCVGCDLSQKQYAERPLCQNTINTSCAFAIAPALPIGQVQPIGLLDILAQTFVIDLAPQ